MADQQPPIVHPRLAATSFGRAIRPFLADPELYAQQGIRLVRYAYPLLDVALRWERLDRELLLRVDATDFNYRPIKGTLLETEPPAGEKKLVPAGLGFQPSGRPDGRPGAWFCFAGWAEWHDHNGHHRERSWASLRNDPAYSPLAMILQLHSTLQRTGVNPA